jgi:hypothetical protein
MFLKFNFILLVVIFAAGMSPITTAWDAWGCLSLGVCDMKYKNEVARMMVRIGAALMSRSGRNDGGKVGGKMRW